MGVLPSLPPLALAVGLPVPPEENRRRETAHQRTLETSNASQPANQAVPSRPGSIYLRSQGTDVAQWPRARGWRAARPRAKPRPPQLRALLAASGVREQFHQRPHLPSLEASGQRPCSRKRGAPLFHRGSQRQPQPCLRRHQPAWPAAPHFCHISGQEQPALDGAPL